MIRLEDTRWVEELVSGDSTLRLVDTSVLHGLVEPYSMCEFESLEDAIEAINQDPNHEERIEVVASNLSRLMMDKAAFIRTEVIDLVEDIHSDVDDLVKNAATTSMVSFEVAPIRVPQFAKGEIFEAIYDTYKGRDVPSGKYAPKYGDLSKAEVHQSINRVFPNEDTFAEIMALDAACPGLFHDLYQAHFLNRKKVEPSYTSVIKPFFIQYGELAAMARMILAYTALEGGFDEFVIGDEVEVRLHGESFAIPASVTYRNLARVRDTYESGPRVFMSSMPYENKTLYLIGESKYNDLVAQGRVELVTGAAVIAERVGTIENLYGLFTEQREFRLTEERAGKLLQANQEFVAKLKLTAKMANIGRVREATAKVIVGMINSGEIKREGTSLEDLRTLARKAIADMEVFEHDGLYRSIRRLVCNTFFPDTGAHEFLTMMDELGAQQLGEDSSETATLAAVQMYAKWGNSQLEG